MQWLNRNVVLCFLVVVFLSGLSCRVEENGKQEDEWHELFNGVDLTGWTVKGKPEDQGEQFWSVKDGAIVANSLGFEGHDYVWLQTDDEYRDFVLRLRFQAYRESPGNTGVQVRSRYDDEAGWLDGPQIDINPPGFWRTGMIWDETRGVQRWIFPNLPADQWVDESMSNESMVFYYSDQSEGWNELEITAMGVNLSATLNKIAVTDFDGQGILNDRVHADRNVGMKGHIALQIHKGDQVEVRFRDLRIRALPRR